ncbi:MAG: UbiA family prenyltransferase [Flavobacteriales bacterium]|nr:UbiA family prenyltransferase [Flavobacteriales bacterium]
MALAAGTGRDKVEGPTFLSAVFLNAHGLLALGAAAQRWWIGEVGPATNWKGILAAGLATVAGYGYLRLVRADGPDIIPSGHIHWVRRHRTAMIALVGLCAIATVILCWGQALVFGSWSLVVVALLGLYLLPLQGAHGRSIGLREIPGLKAILVAAGWTFVTMGVSTSDPTHVALFDGWVAAVQFCFFFALAITTDIGDLKYDRPGLKTIPQVFGVRGAKVLAVILMVPVIWYYIVSQALVAASGMGMRAMIVLPLIGSIIAAGAIALVREDRPKWYFAILLDGMVLLIPLLGWLGQQV